MVRQGSEAIETWRREHPGICLDLRGADLNLVNWEAADLSGATLEKAILSKAHLLDANLDGCNLQGADLNEAQLSGANFKSACLKGALLADSKCRTTKFSRADLSNTALHRADLFEAWLDETDLSGAYLLGTNLTTPYMLGTKLYGAVMSNVILGGCPIELSLGLETVSIVGWSHVTVSTLYGALRTGGGRFSSTVRSFFLTVGVPEALLDYLPALYEANPIQFYSCFISYGTDDNAFADKLFGDLVARGVKCFKYDKTSVVGRGTWETISQAIRIYDKVIVVCSEQSLHRSAVCREIERALKREDELRNLRHENPRVDCDVLFPVRLDDYVFDGWEHGRCEDVREKTIGDFREWHDPGSYERELERLLVALNPKSWPLS